LAIFIKIKYYLLFFFFKLDFHIITYKILEINNKFTAFIYYYGEREKNLLLDKLYKIALQTDIKCKLKINVSINVFNIINFLPRKVQALNQKLKTSIKRPKNNKFP
jgi:hypothetical protein